MLTNSCRFKVNAQLLVGYEAKKMNETDPKNVIYDVKRIVGRRYSDPEVDRFREDHQFELTNDAYPKIIIPNHGITIRPEQVGYDSFDSFMLLNCGRFHSLHCHCAGKPPGKFCLCQENRKNIPRS